MNRLFKRFSALSLSSLRSWTAPLALLLACLASYALLIQRLGFYWDDWPINWIAARLGPAGLARYFSTNRPYWGMLYQLTTSMLGSVPWHWQVFAIFWRWMTGVALWGLVRLAWPRQSQAAAWAALLFVVYPGFEQQFISLVYSHFFIVLTVFLVSLGCTLLALRRPRWFWPLTVLALLLSFINLITMEYFFLLELVRPALIWIVLSETVPDRHQRLKQAFKVWLPYLLLFIALVVWRAFFFRFQTQNYRPKILEQLKAQPLQAVLALLGRIAGDLWLTTFAAWGKVFQLPDPALLGGRTTQVYALIVVAAAALLGLYVSAVKNRPSDEGTAPSRNGSQPGLQRGAQPGSQRGAQRAWAWPCLLTGLLALLLAGWPFWLTQIPVGLSFPNDRFTLSFMLGSTLFITGLLGLLPLPHWSKVVMLGVLLGLAIGMQFQVANAYRRDWATQKALFWQLAWRMPQLKPGTTLLFNDLPVRYFSDNSLTAPLNWIFDSRPDQSGQFPDPTGMQMGYMLYFPSLRLGTGLPSLQPGQAITQDYLASEFNGSTSQMIALNYIPPACVRVLDPDLDPFNTMLPTRMRESAAVSTTQPVQDAPPGQAALPEAQIFGAEPAHSSWCYYFEKADLARQLGDWAKVASLGDQAFGQTDYPNDPSERLVFIEGYAHTGNWQRAHEISQEARQVTAAMQPMLCRLWQRIDESTPSTPAKTTTLQSVHKELQCP
jgi:hypothetical protein